MFKKGERSLRPRLSALCALLIFTSALLFTCQALFLPVEVAKAADPTTIVTIMPPTHVALSIGEIFDEAVTISTDEGINSIDVTITYNATLLGIISVHQGSFFPQEFPPTNFTYENNLMNGTLHISTELLDPQVQTGNGTLADITFESILDPKTLVYSPIGISDLVVLDSLHQPLSYGTLGSIYFWKFVTPPIPPVTARIIDLYTQRGGIGQGTYGGEFAPGSLVILSALATYNDWPVQRLFVAFQIQNSRNQTVAVLIGTTDESGVATVQFRILNDASSEGTWTVIATVDISCTIVLDKTNFVVLFPHIVGGYTVNTSNRQDPTPMYLATLSVLVAAVTLSRRGRRLR